MSLEGALDVFRLPEIFELLRATGKTGGLQVLAPEGHGAVFFAAGRIAAASSDVTRQGLARRVVGSGQVADAELAAAVTRVTAEPGLGVVRALLEAGALPEPALRELAGEHTVDAVFDLLRWPAGRFRFELDAADADRLGLGLAVEEVVGEARRRLADWPRVRALVPSLDAVVTLAVAPGADPQLSRPEWALLALVDGRRTVRDLVRLTGRGEYAVCGALAGLIERSLLVVGNGGEGAGAADLVRRQGMLAGLEPDAAPPAPPPAVTIELPPAAAAGGPPPAAEVAGLVPATRSRPAAEAGRDDDEAARRVSLLRAIAALERLP